MYWKVWPPMGTKLLTPEEGWWPSDTKWNHSGPWLVKLKFGALCAPPSSSCGGLMAFIHLIWAMFVYGFHCFLFYSSWGTHRKFP